MPNRCQSPCYRASRSVLRVRSYSVLEVRWIPSRLELCSHQLTGDFCKRKARPKDIIADGNTGMCRLLLAGCGDANLLPRTFLLPPLNVLEPHHGVGEGTCAITQISDVVWGLEPLPRSFKQTPRFDICDECREHPVMSDADATELLWPRGR